VASRSALESPAVLWRRAADGSGALCSLAAVQAGARETDVCVCMYVWMRLQLVDGGVV
jgi:hypothetical protein